MDNQQIPSSDGEAAEKHKDAIRHVELVSPVEVQLLKEIARLANQVAKLYAWCTVAQCGVDLTRYKIGPGNHLRDALDALAQFKKDQSP